MTEKIFTPPSPAPWAIGVRNENGKPQICIIAEDGTVIAKLCQQGTMDGLETTMANARSVAALPFLVNALFTLRDAHIRELLRGTMQAHMTRDEQEAVEALAECNAALDMAVFGTGLPEAPHPQPDPETKH